jgi:hypothetical protein
MLVMHIFVGGAVVVSPSFPYSRSFSEEDQIIILTCNYCFEVVAASGDEAELEAAERQHWCLQQAKAVAA